MSASDAVATFAALAEERRSWLGWTGEPIARDVLLDLIRQAHWSPSECNAQPWRFVVAQGAALGRLLPFFLASNHDKLVEAGTVVVALGDLATVDADPKAAAFYARSTFTPRDYAMRNVSLAAMSFMYAATAHGLGARPMVGFDPDALVAELGLPASWLPVMAIARLVAAGGARRRPGDHGRQLRGGGRRRGRGDEPRAAAGGHRSRAGLRGSARGRRLGTALRRSR